MHIPRIQVVTRCKGIQYEISLQIERQGQGKEPSDVQTPHPETKAIYRAYGGRSGIQDQVY